MRIHVCVCADGARASALVAAMGSDRQTTAFLSGLFQSASPPTPPPFCFLLVRLPCSPHVGRVARNDTRHYVPGHTSRSTRAHTHVAVSHQRRRTLSVTLSFSLSSFLLCFVPSLFRKKKSATAAAAGGSEGFKDSLVRCDYGPRAVPQCAT